MNDLLVSLSTIRNSYVSGGMSDAIREDFQKTILDYYSSHARNLPWRTTQDPYYTLVSELMSQQTQIERVVPKFLAFIDAFPSIGDLAKASFSEVLSYWSGLGYNRRAKYLHDTSRHIIKQLNGNIPSEYEALLALPGIGPYTARAIQAFAFNMPVVIIETNVRTVFFYVFFSSEKNVSDAQLSSVVEPMICRANPRDWYNALMDVGSVIKSEVGNYNKQSKHYSVQSPFEGSDRQLRGRILRLALDVSRLTAEYISQETNQPALRVRRILAGLVSEGLMIKDNGEYTLC